MEKPITVEEAIKTALALESKVKQVYSEAEHLMTDKVGRDVMHLMAEEEQGHYDYLTVKLAEWQNKGAISGEPMKTSLPSKKVIEEEVTKLREKVQSHDKRPIENMEVKMLNNALEVEIETSDFYKRMVDEMQEEVRPLFTRFLEIEEGHKAMVQAELDYLTSSGFWFDLREFDVFRD